MKTKCKIVYWAYSKEGMLPSQSSDHVFDWVPATLLDRATAILTESIEWHERVSNAWRGDVKREANRKLKHLKTVLATLKGA